MRYKHVSFFAQIFCKKSALSGSISGSNVRFKSTLIDLMMIENGLMNPIMQRDFEQYLDAKVTFDAKLYTFYQHARELLDVHCYTDAINELQKIVALTKKIDINDLTQNQVQLLANTYATLASILRVGSSDDEIMARHCCDKALELNPSHIEAMAIRNSILSERVVFPTDPKMDFVDDDQRGKFRNRT